MKLDHTLEVIHVFPQLIYKLQVYKNLQTFPSWLAGLEVAWELSVNTTPLTERNNPGQLPCNMTPSTLTANWDPLGTLIHSPFTRGCGVTASYYKKTNAHELPFKLNYNKTVLTLARLSGLMWPSDDSMYAEFLRLHNVNNFSFYSLIYYLAFEGNF